MGVKNLWDILETCKKTLPLHHLQNKKLCVDLSCWLIQFQNAYKSPASVKEKLYLRNLFHRLRALIALNCSLIFVTDGAIPSLKLSTYRRRLGSGSEDVMHEDTNSQLSLRRNAGSRFSCMIKEAKALGLALGIPCLDGIEEAEAQCALLNLESLCDGCFSADSDIFLFGARTVYRDIFFGEAGYVVCYEMVDIERKLGFGRNSLITLALLLGGDYSQGVYGIGPEAACQLLKSIGDDKILQSIKLNGLAIAKKASKGSKKATKSLDCNPDKENLVCIKQHMATNWEKPEPDDHLLQVIRAYLMPKCHLPDSEAVMSACFPHPFLRASLQRICDVSFGWCPEKADEYILPKIAQRDLIRFANLRNASCELGVHIPLDKMPVPCPITAILKQRKVQGKECFEVSWHEIDGLRTSVVSADLVESACPEKILAFMDKKSMAAQQKKNRKPKPRQPAKPYLNKVDERFRGILLDIESQSTAQPDDPQVLPAATRRAIGPEVIDLTSPSPPLRSNQVSKRHENLVENTDIIDLCITDADESLEHKKKARELRMFIESIRGDLY